ncbi:TIGR02270 family protein [Archangium sp.]|uniref:TIGR02270 family protein n=1 Tax=Archangium sp. TaxID=1872627 RepID=UPI002D47D75D|nr:TIGR02270 family protein [Archangium sp.]HYO53978.1 TIGR02270 family protein [Archangium sp.]
MRVRQDLLPRWDVYEEHLDEAAFLWGQWERALVAPDFDVEETADLEARLLAHLEGLAEAGAPAAGHLLRPALESEEPERLSSAALALLAGHEAGAMADLRLVLKKGEPGSRAPIRRALEVWTWQACAEHMHTLLASPEPALRALALEVLAFQGVVLPSAVLDRMLVHEEAALRIAALRCARFLEGGVRPELLFPALVSTHPAIRLAAIETGLLQGSRAAWEACKEMASSRGAGCAEAWVLLAIGGSDGELHMLLRALETPSQRPGALWALGFSGRVDAAEACLELMREAPVAALAAEAFSAITGLAIQGHYAAPDPEDAESALPPLEEDLDADLSLKPEAALAVPAPEAASAWWRQARKGFERSERYLYGQPFSAEMLLKVLERGPMRRRHVLALELAIRSKGKWRIQTRAFTCRQRVEMGRLRATPSVQLARHPFAQMLR